MIQQAFIKQLLNARYRVCWMLEKGKKKKETLPTFGELIFYWEIYDRTQVLKYKVCAVLFVFFVPS